MAPTPPTHAHHNLPPLLPAQVTVIPMITEQQAHYGSACKAVQHGSTGCQHTVQYTTPSTHPNTNFEFAFIRE